MQDDVAWHVYGHAPRHLTMLNACLFGSNNLFFQKTLIFWESSQNLCAKVAKAKACSSQGQSNPPRAKAAPNGHAAVATHGHAARARHATKAEAAYGHASKAKAAPYGHATTKA